ncbi:hypothetical protein DMI65_14785 [Escherichia coli]|nr:hypothetical protein [Escherichia coli]
MFTAVQAAETLQLTDIAPSSGSLPYRQLKYILKRLLNHKTFTAVQAAKRLHEFASELFLFTAVQAVFTLR